MSMPSPSDLRAAGISVFDQVVSLRREIHATPELSFEEYKTAEKVKRTLEEIGIPFRENVAKTGIVATLQGKSGGKTLALRADMDALPIQELNEVAYKSVNPGVMHACGHDVHTASLLGAARILKDMQHSFAGTIRLIFQPSEEKLPGGASVMIREGVLDNPRVSGIIGQHVMPLIDAGKVAFRSGMYMASTDEIYLTIRGKGGHGAQPHTTIDPVAIAAQAITAAQQVVSRTIDPRIPAVLTFGKFIANGATNIIPDSVYIEGTFRTFDETWRDLAHKQIVATIEGICKAMGATAELEIRRGYPVLVNDEALTTRARAAAVAFLGESNVLDLDLWMAAEDFAWYTHEVPGCFYRLGTRNESKGIVHGLHTPRFDIDEDALKISSGLMAFIALRELAT